MKPNHVLVERTTDQPNLVCIPYAGGNAAAFRLFKQHFHSTWHVITPDPPGHGANRDSLLDDLEALVRYYLDALRPAFTEPFALFGHSMGGKVVHRLAQELEAEGINPRAVIVSAMYPPDVRCPKVSHLEREPFLEYMISLGGIQEELLKHDGVLDFFMPIFRADFKAVEEHVSPNLAPLKSPLYIFTGSDDSRATWDRVSGWTKWGEQVQFTVFEGGGHMFLLQQADQVAAKVSQILR